MAHIHEILDTDLHFIIDPFTRQLRIDTKVAEESHMTIIQYDHNSERVTFEIPKEVDGHDMSLCNVVQVHYLNVSTDGRTTASGVYEVKDLQASGDVVVGTWLISQNATQLAGTLNFLIRFVCTTDSNLDYVWNTAVYQSIAVSSGLYNGEEVVAEYADILEQWRRSLVGISSIAQTVTSTQDGGDNVLTIALSDGTEKTFIVQNGKKGSTGARGSQGERGFKGDTGYSLLTAPMVALSGATTLRGQYVNVPNGYTVKVGDLVLLANGMFFRITAINSSNNTYTVSLFADLNSMIPEAPEKGVDYFTPEEIQEVAELAASMVEVPEAEEVDLSGYVRAVNGVTPDENGNVEVRRYPDWSHLKWYVMGDSLTAQDNAFTDKRYYDFVREKTGIQTIVDGIGGTGYGAGVSDGQSFVDRVKNIPEDVDVVTIFGSGNDIRYADGANSQIYHALEWLLTNRPGLRVIVVPPAPWKDYNKREDPWKAYCDRLQVCALACECRYISDMYDCAPFNGNNTEHMATFFSTDPDGIHPNENGHKALAPYFYNALRQELALKE